MSTYPSILKAAHLERGMRWMIFLSLCLHLCLFAAILGKPPDRGTTVYFNPAYTVELIGTGGSAGLPDLQGIGETGSSTSDAAAKSAPAGKAEPLWKGPSGFTSQMKTLEQREHVPFKAATATKAPSQTTKTGAGSGSTKTGSGSETGRQGAAASNSGKTRGTGGVGGAGYGLTPEQARFGRYYMAVFNKIQSAWILPHYYEQDQRMATVEITIRADGRIVNTQFEKKSGNAEFDRSVMRAIQKANPLPPLPPGIKEPLLTLGIRFQ